MATVDNAPPSPLPFPERTPRFIEHLPVSQRKAFEELKALCDQSNLYWPVSDLERQPEHGSNDDNDLLRFLRARDFDPRAAYEQYSLSAAWRRKTALDSTYDNVDINRFSRMSRVQPQWTGRRDKYGVPLMVYVLSEVRPEDLTQIAKEDPQLSEIFLAAEYVTRFVQRLSTRLPHARIDSNNEDDSPIDKTVNIIDLSNVGLRKFWNLRSLLQTASSMATANYPETVERIFVLGAPYFFPTVWSLVTRWFDPKTTRKIFVLSASQQEETLLEYIAKENLPKRFGGELDWNMGDSPILDEEAMAMVGRLKERWVDGPIRYISQPVGDKLMAVGSVDGVLRREVLAQYPARPSISSKTKIGEVL